MASTTAPGSITINDITLSVPPLEIVANKDAANYEWQTLRTKNATKVASHHGTLNISMSCVFVGQEAINTELRYLICQLRLTPICYVENEFIRTNCAPSTTQSPNPSNQDPILLILKNMTLSIESSMPDTITAHFEFAWFNYLPYVHSLRFQSTLTSSTVTTPVTSPSQSPAWEAFYASDLANYGIMNLSLASNLTFQFNDFLLLPNNTNPDKISGQGGSVGQAVVQPPSVPPPYIATQVPYLGFANSSPYQLVYKQNQVVVNNSNGGLVNVGMTVSFENIISMIPLLGHTYATFQHLGSIDPHIIIRLNATEEAGHQSITQMWNTLQSTSIPFRHLPQADLNLTVINDFLQLCGIKKCLVDSLTDETLQGQVGNFAMTLSMRGTDFEVGEYLQQEFLTTESLRALIANDMNQYIEMDPDTSQWYPLIPNTSSQALLYNDLNQYCDLINTLLEGITDYIGLALAEKGFGVAQLASFVQQAEQYYLGGQNNTTLGDDDNLIVSIQNMLKYFLGAGNINPNEFFATFPELDPVGGSIQNLEATNEIIQSVVAFKPPYVDPAATRFDPLAFAPLTTFDQGLQKLCDQMTQDGSLNFPQFADALVAASKIGAFTGRSAYPDFSTLSTVANQLKVDQLTVDPDFYFYSNTTNAITSAVDTWMFNEATSWGQDLYVNGETGYINQFNNYLQNTYLKRFRTDNTVYPKLTAGATQRIAEFGPQGKNSSFIPSSNAAVGQYANALASPKALAAFVGQDVDPVNAAPAVGTSSQSYYAPLSHNADPGFIFGDSVSVGPPAQATQSVPNVQFAWPCNGPIPAGGEYGTERSGYTSSNGNTVGDHEHEGLDISVAIGTQIQATAAGTIENPGIGTGAAGLRIWINHANGYQSRYLHLSSIANNSATGLAFAAGDQVQQGTVIGYSGQEKGHAHLHFEIWHNGQTIDPQSVLNNGSLANSSATGTSTQVSLPADDKGEGARFGNSILARSIGSLEQELKAGQAERMIRAYPTFKLYFVAEQDYSLGAGGRFLGFDDFFNYNSVKSIRVVRSRKVPADLCVIELTNISGILSNRSFKDQLDPFGYNQGGAARNAAGQLANRTAALQNPKLVNTKDANPIASLMLEEGTKVWLKLGYANDPAKLEDVFVGQITEVEFSETDDLITIICQAYTTELTQQIKGQTVPIKRGTSSIPLALSNFLGFNDACTGYLLSDMIQCPEAQHFGRWVRSRRMGLPATNTNLPYLNNKFEWNPAPADDNIFPPVADYSQFLSTVNKGFNWLISDWSHGPQLKALQVIPLNYWIYKTTIWDIFKEMELRHPGCIASPVPYIDAKFGPRMTMFFGLPNQLYFHRDPTPLENTQNNQLAATVAANQPPQFSMTDPAIEPPAASFDPENPNGAYSFESIAAGTAPPLPKSSPTGLQKALNQGSITPFRAYHVLTSNNHIVENNLRCSSLDTYNTVSIQYSSGPTITGGAVAVEANQLVSTSPDVFRLKADAGLPDETVRELFLTYPTCVGESMAEYYALGALRNTLRDMYKGEITVIGNPTIKPYDICYVFDEYTDMVGPIEVEQVIHVFSKETGFLTEIVPNICVTVNEWSTMTTIDAMGVVGEGVVGGLFKSQITKSTPAPAPNTTSPLTISTGVSIGKVQSLVQQTNGVAASISGQAAADTSGSYGLTPQQQALAANQGQNSPSPLSGGTLTGLAIGAATITAPETVAAGAILGIFLLSKYVSWSQYLHPITLAPVHYKGRPLTATMGAKTIDQNWWTRFKRWLNNGVAGEAIFEQDLGDYLTLNPNFTNVKSLLAGNLTNPIYEGP